MPKWHGRDRRERGSLASAGVTSRQDDDASGAMAPGESADADDRLFQAVVCRRIAHPDVALARRPERAARHHGHPLLDEEPLGELVGRQARRRDPGERVEGPPRLERIEPEAVEAVDEEPPAAVVL